MRLLRRVPLTPLGWIVVVLVVGLGATAVIIGSVTVAVIAAVGLVFVLLLAAGAPRNVRDLDVPPTLVPPVIPPRDDDPSDR
jgi:hypothetical protein